MNESKSLYGLQTETVDSLILDMLPPVGYKFKELKSDTEVSQISDIHTVLITEILNAFRKSAGFNSPMVGRIIIINY